VKLPSATMISALPSAMPLRDSPQAHGLHGRLDGLRPGIHEDGAVHAVREHRRLSKAQAVVVERPRGQAQAPELSLGRGDDMRCRCP